jgi:cyclopropane fatty-acyl-phospholipid synthase-like methyltransferase
MSDITSMGLYRNADRILADLAASGIDPDGPLEVDQLTPFDQFHYEGTAAVDDAIEALGITGESSVLDVGSGLGGPARYVAHRKGCQVTALELQHDLDRTAAALTRRCGLDGLVHHLRGNVLEGAAPPGSFTAIMSMLCFLHIPDRTTLFAQCARALKPGGVMFIDDYVERGRLSKQERAALAEKVHCTYLPDLETYVAQVRATGFTDVEVVDKTVDWTSFVTDRLDAFQNTRDELVDRYGEQTVDTLHDFYGVVVDLFRGGRLGGLRLVARRAQS